jgi:hypothetical protein
MSRRTLKEVLEQAHTVIGFASHVLDMDNDGEMLTTLVGALVLSCKISGSSRAALDHNLNRMWEHLSEPAFEKKMAEFRRKHDAEEHTKAAKGPGFIN